MSVDGEILGVLDEVMARLEKLESLGCRVDLNLTLNVSLPDVEYPAEKLPPLPLITRFDVIRLLVYAAEGGIIEEVERLTPIFKVKSFREVLTALLKLGKASPKEIRRETLLPEPTIYRALKKLCDIGLISKAEKISPKRKGGPRTQLYVISKEVAR